MVPPRSDLEVREIVRVMNREDLSRAFDDEALLARCLGDRSLADRVLQKFLSRLPNDADKIRVAFDDHNRDGVRRAAHALKGAAANVGATGIATIATEIERVARDSAAEWEATVERELGQLDHKVTEAASFSLELVSSP